MESTLPLLSKSQAHDVGVLVELSLKLTVRGAVPLSGVALKPATGAGGGGVPPSGS